MSKSGAFSIFFPAQQSNLNKGVLRIAGNDRTALVTGRIPRPNKVDWLLWDGGRNVCSETNGTSQVATEGV
jgi:hypothetical protein